MSQGKTSARSSKSGFESASQQSSYGDSYTDSYSTYGTGSEPDYIMLEIRIKQQTDDINHLHKQNRRLAEDLDLERCQGMQRLKKLDAAAKLAEKRIQELSVELARSRETVQQSQELHETQASQMQELAANKELLDDRRGIEARIQQLEAEIAHTKEEIKNGNYESTQQRAAIRKAQEERCIAQRLLEASEKERGDLAKKLAELELLNRRQENALKGAAEGWLKKNHEMDVQREELRWKMVDSKSAQIGGNNRRRREAAPAAVSAVSGGSRRQKTAAPAAAAEPTGTTRKSKGAASVAGSSASGQS